MSLKFGTSGLRGIASAFEYDKVAPFIMGFLEYCAEASAERTLVVGQDLRKSSPLITQHVSNAARAYGWAVLDAGQVPTPALACYAMNASYPSVMVTGSHIPEDYNGLKFYKPSGELLKSDEQPLRALAEGISINLHDPVLMSSDSTRDVHDDVVALYKKRFTQYFGVQALNGVRLGVYQHSAVGRDMLVDILRDLGADCAVFGRVNAFVAVDTEAVDQDIFEIARLKIAEHHLDAVVSTDGDGDRPLVIGAEGTQINGDILGILSAIALEADTVVTPLTTTSALELSGKFTQIVRTKIGSPYVVEAMDSAQGNAIVGFEANGGFLTQSGFRRDEGRLEALPTRDAILPIIAPLVLANTQQLSLSALVGMLPSRVMLADRLKEISPEMGSSFLAAIYVDLALRDVILPALSHAREISTLDGVRFVLDDGRVVHFRQSGNAPEFRCYVETSSVDETQKLLGTLIIQITKYFSEMGE